MKAVHELGSERCETVRSLSTVNNIKLLEALHLVREDWVTSTTGPSIIRLNEYRWLAKLVCRITECGYLDISKKTDFIGNCLIWF